MGQARMPLLIGFALGLFLALAAASPARTAEDPPLFGSREIASDSLAIFPKWTGMLERYFAAAVPEGDCAAAAFNRCHLAQWQTLIESLRGADVQAQLDAVNRHLNEAPYITDIVNYGLDDYWATPGQFLARDGDCEDYAIAKFMSLRALGFKNEQLRVVVLNDLNLGVGHAVLAVYLPTGIEILDNQVAQVVPAARIHHYAPLYSINETRWWLHRPL